MGWGDMSAGGDIDDMDHVDSQLNEGIEHVWSTNWAFLAKLKTGNTVAWGRCDSGGDISTVKQQIDKTPAGLITWAGNGEMLCKEEADGVLPDARESLTGNRWPRKVTSDGGSQAGGDGL